MDKIKIVEKKEKTLSSASCSCVWKILKTEEMSTTNRLKTGKLPVPQKVKSSRPAKIKTKHAAAREIIEFLKLPAMQIAWQSSEAARPWTDTGHFSTRERVSKSN